MYKDNGFTIFMRKWSVRDVVDWLEDFRLNVNQVSGNDFLKFTATIWEEGSLDRGVRKVSVQNETSVPYLDMSLYWSTSGRLATRI